jgi:hypothetical protein
VAALGGTRLASASANVPNNACSIKVTDQVTFPAYFATLLGYETRTVAARAAARVAPTGAPTLITGVWPVAHWAGDPAPCADQVGSLCTFWDSNAPPGGNFKQTINMSRYSELSGAINRNQHWVDYDHLRPGTRTKNTDVPGWLRHGWGGTVFVDEQDSRCQTGPSASLACPNSKLEVYGGTGGSNVGSAMRDYISDPKYLEGTDPSRGNYATVNVFFWRYGEQDINATTNAGTLWLGPSNPDKIQRVILQKVRRFRFYTSTVSSSSATGYFVSSLNFGGVPTNGPPSTIANTVLTMAD